MEVPEPEEAKASNGNTPHRFKTGQSIAWFFRQPIDHDQTILGKRYLCRGCGMWIIAPSGLGKSTLSFQAAILWSVGKSAFGIASHRPRRVLIVQAEDDQGDCTEMSLMINHLGLNEEEKAQVEENTEVIHCNELSGKAFVEALRVRLIEARRAGKPFDLIVINPYGVFQGGNVQDPLENTRFLNHLLNPLLTEFNVAAIGIHHTAKTNFVDFDKFHPWDFQYSGAGSGNMTNWARAILVIVPQEVERLFMFVAAKRGQRLEEWQGSSTKLFSHSDGNPMVWIDASEEQRAKRADAQRKKAGHKPTRDEVFKRCLSVVEWRHFVEIHEKAQKIWKIYGVKLLQTQINTGIEEGVLERQKSDDSVTKTLWVYRIIGNQNNNNDL